MREQTEGKMYLYQRARTGAQQYSLPNSLLITFQSMFEIMSVLMWKCIYRHIMHIYVYTHTHTQILGNLKKEFFSESL